MTDYALALSDAELIRYQFMAQAALAEERDFWAAAGIVEGAAVADVGCGPGAISVVLARLVGSTGTVWAVDRGAEALTVAKATAERSGVANVRFHQGEAADTGLDPAGVDVVMMRHVLAHNGGREQAIVDHLATLVRPGGHVYLVDVDATALRMRPSDPDLADLNERYGEFHARQGNDLAIGLRLGELLEAAGLECVDHRGFYHIIPTQPGLRPPSWAARDAMIAAGVADADDVARWGAALNKLDEGASRFTLFVPQFCATGRRPG